jgi:hypothetical protein
MLQVLFNIIVFSLLYIISLFNFNDAAKAVGEGVLSYSSTSNFSLIKVNILYGSLLLGAVLASFLCFKFFKKYFIWDTPAVSIEDTKIIFPRLSKRDFLFIGIFCIIIACVNLLLKEKIFNLDSLYNEEFYNLSALNELKNNYFSIIYPYSVGNLLLGGMLSKFGIGFIYYKIFLNSLSIVLAYYCLAIFIKKFFYRIAATLWLFLFYFFNSTIAPALHSNNLRLFLPVISIILLFNYTNKYYQVWQRKFLALTLIFIFVLFFGSADSIAIFSVLYILFALYQFLSNLVLKEKLVLIFAPIMAVAVMFLFFGPNYWNLALSQVLSIINFSGYVGSASYPNLFAIFNSRSLFEFVKVLIFTLIYYLPFLMLINLIFYFFIICLNKDERQKNSFLFVIFLFFAYVLNFRKALSEGGAGQVVTSSIVLVFILLVIKRYFKPDSFNKIILRVGIFFLSIIFFVGLYFMRYSILHFYSAYQEYNTNTSSLIPCSETIFKDRLAFAGYMMCQKDLIDRLVEVKKIINEKPFYVFDDTFALYYLLEGDPVELVPSMYMAFKQQDILVNKIEKMNVEYMIYPRQKHFFRVPDPYIKDPQFMKNINLYRDDKFEKTFVSPMFEVFKLIK